MSKNGGYVIIDFKDINITSETGVTAVGIFNDIESSGRKAILVSGITLDGVEQRDVFVEPVVNSGNYTFTAYGHTFTVTHDDGVTIA